MGFSTLNNHDLIRRLRSIGLTNTLARQIVAQFQDWRTASGDEWTCGHLKDLKVDLIRHMGGLPPIAPWVERRKDKVTPTGPFGALWKLSKNKPFTALNAINIYTSLLYERKPGQPAVTPKQLAKFEDAVMRPAVPAQATEAFTELLKDLPMEWHSSPPRYEAPAILDVPIKPYKRSPIPFRGLVPKEDVFPRALTVLSLAPSFYWKHRALIDTALGDVRDLVPMASTGGGDIRVEPSDPIPVVLNKIKTKDIPGRAKDRPEDVMAGQVSFIQDSGYKLRHIFVTNELLQICSLPLQEFLMSELREIPQDATYNQDAAVSRVQEFIRQGYTAHSFDLQSCSDNLPRSFQIKLFRHLGLPESWISWFSDVTNGLWLVSETLPTIRPDKKVSRFAPDPKPVFKSQLDIVFRMTVGQQLGFGPSFPAFALLHHAIIRGLARQLGRPMQYVLLGDDVVIFDDPLAIAYRGFMEMAGVPISSTKTIVSKRVAEFAGKVILPDKVVSAYKWRGRCSDNNFLDICKALGPRSLGLLRPRQRFIAEILGWIPEPFGLGWNPQGLPYSQRVAETEELWLKLWEEKDIRVRRYHRKTSRMNRMVYGYPEWTRGLHLSPSSDQEDLTVFLEHFPLKDINAAKRLAFDWTLLLPNIDYLARSLDIGGLGGKDVSDLLSRYSWIERLSKLSQLTILERRLGFSQS